MPATATAASRTARATAPAGDVAGGERGLFSVAFHPDWYLATVISIG
jgi:hypothetical protein